MNVTSDAWTLVTGASSGLGRAFAILLAREGRKVILVGRDEKRLEEARVACAQAFGASPFGERAVVSECMLAFRSDLSMPGAAEELHARCASGFMDVDFLINNAGAGIFGESVGISPDKLASMIALNVTALTQLCALFGADMKAKGRGAILNVGSFAGKQATPYFASYAATKSYVLRYSHALRAELAGSGVQVTCLMPGYVKTAFDGNAGASSRAYRAFSERNAMEAEAVAAIGLRAARLGRAGVIAGARNQIVAFLLGLLPESAVPFVQKALLDRLVSAESNE
jgi:short-subunit dehydrogenase